MWSLKNMFGRQKVPQHIVKILIRFNLSQIEDMQRRTLREEELNLNETESLNANG